MLSFSPKLFIWLPRLKHIYTLLFFICLPLILLRLIWRGFRAPAYWHRWGERFGYMPKLTDPRPVIWCHAVSVGEVEASRPLIQALQRDYPEYQILVTTMTPTGSARVLHHFTGQVSHYYLPYDLPFAVRPFLKRMRPAIGIIMETEIWPNLISNCHQRNIPLILANARMSERSARGYQHISGFSRDIIYRLTKIATQTETDRNRLIALGAAPERIHAIGNLKYEINLPASLTEQCTAIQRLWSAHRQVWVAASTHEGEESQILQAMEKIHATIPDVLLILVPRHPERFDRVFNLCQQAGFNTIRRSTEAVCSDEVTILVGDTMGELPLFYGASDLAFVGGSLIPHGGHNLLEPAALGRAVITGPHHFNFTEISSHFFDANAAIEVHDADSLADTVIRLLQDAALRSTMGEAGRQHIAKSQGASKRLLSLIEQHLPHL